MAGLPPDAAVYRSGWTQQFELLANQMEVNDFWLRAIFARVYQATDKDGKPPEHMPPPFWFDHPDREDRPDVADDEPGEIRDSEKLRGLFGPTNMQEEVN